MQVQYSNISQSRYVALLLAATPDEPHTIQQGSSCDSLNLGLIASPRGTIALINGIAKALALGMLINLTIPGKNQRLHVVRDGGDVKLCLR